MWLSRGRLSKLFFLLVLFLPTQFGKHFFPHFSTILGIRVDYLSPTIYFTDILTLVFIAACYLRPAYRDFLKGIIVRNKVSFVVIITLLTISAASSQILPLALYGTIKFVEMAFLGLSVFWMLQHTAEGLASLRKAFLIGLLFQSLLAAAQYYLQGSLNEVFYFLGERLFTSQTPGIALAVINGATVLRPYGTFSHPNVLAAFIVIAQAIVLFQKQVLSKKIWLILGISTIALFLTMSRLAFLAWAVMMVVYFLRGKIPKLSWLMILGVIGAFLFLPLSQRFAPSMLFGEAATIRLALAQSAWKIVQANPFFGAGMLHFIPKLAEYPFHYPTLFSLQPVHNIFLLVAAETGLLGLVLFCHFLLKAIVQTKRAIAQRILLSPLLLFFFFFLGSGDHYFLTLQQGMLLTVIIFAIIWNSPAAVVRKGREKKK